MTKKTAKLAVLWLPLILPAYVLRVQIGPIPTTALELAFFAVAVFATIASSFAIWKKGFTRLRPFHIAAGLWLLATIIAIFVAPNHIAALGLWRAFVLEPMAYAILVAGIIENEKDSHQLLSALIWSVIGVTVIAIIQFATGHFIPHPWDTALSTRRATGPFPYPNALALYVTPIAALCFGLMMSTEKAADRLGRHKIRPYVIYIGFIAGLVSILLAKSVGGFMGLLAAVVFALVWEKRTRIATFIILFFAAYALFQSPLQSKVMTTLSFGEWSGRVRTVMWNETVQMLSTRQFFGAGFGAYPTVIVPYHRATWMEIFQYPHNILLNLWSETGLLGLVAFTGLALTWARLSLQKDQENRAGARPAPTYFLLPLIAIIIHGIVDVPYFKNDLAFVFWILIVLIITERI